MSILHDVNENLFTLLAIPVLVSLFCSPSIHTTPRTRYRSQLLTMSIFRKRTSNETSRSISGGGPGTINGTDSLHSREALTTPHPASRAAGIPRPDRRIPREAIGVSRLLDTYDEYEHMKQLVASMEVELAEESARAEEAEHARAALESDLSKEKTGRESDRKQAIEDKKQAEKDMEKKIRDDLEPKIKDLKEKLGTTEKERDGLRKEVKEKTEGMERWVGMMERLHKERSGAETRERNAAEERRKLDEKLKELDGQILKGMKDWAKPVEKVDSE